MNINRVTIAGNLTRAVEIKALPSGVQVAQFSLATNRTYKDKSGQKQESVEFVNFVAFGRTAEVLAQYAVKGQNLYCEGRLQTRSWDDKDGKKQYRTEVVLESFQFGQKPKGAQDDWAQANHGAEDQSAPAAKSGGVDYPDDEINPDDIPF